MARSITTIFNSIIAAVTGDPTLSGLLTSPASKRSHWRMWAYVFSGASNTQEQLSDAYIAKNEAIIKKAHAANGDWIQAIMFLFQYDATTPQIIQLNTTTKAYEYPIVDVGKRIIVRCSVRKTLYKTVQIKIAKGTTPQKCSSGEIAAAQSYIDIQGNMGATYEVISLDPDLLYVDADVYFNGQYASVISGAVQASMTDYLAIQSSQDNFDGKIKLTDLEAVMRNTLGVTDVVLKNVAVRAAAVSFANKYYLVKNNTELAKDWKTVAGYIVQETDTGHTWTNTLNFIAE